MQPKIPTDIGVQILVQNLRIHHLVERVASLEHFSNQSSILVDTLGKIMEELKKQEH